jgi:uncharacterized protein (TIGR00251 family)
MASVSGGAPREPWVAVRGADLLLRLRIQPRAAHEGFAGVHDGRLRVRIGAPPVEGAANVRLVELLAGCLSLPRAAFSIERGTHARCKDVLVRGAATRHAQIVAALTAQCLSRNTASRI